ncbi:MAG: hypothetical protein KOO66_08240 [Bacteroidales bacterium]|nr:hypothetical protein [Bacteroidales bacterium]
MEIKYLKHNQIDKQKWDFVIEKSDNGLVYSLSWYLDIVSPGWEALIDGDYKAIMPLPVKKKYGLKYLIQPPFCQQLGAYYKESNAKIATTDFLKLIPSKYRFIALNLDFDSGKYCTERTNFELNLTSNFESIRSNFSTNTKRNINKAKKQELNVVENISPKELWNFKKGNPVNDLSKWHYQKLLSIIESAVNKGIGESYSVTNNQNDILAVVFLINYKNRLTFLVSSSNEFGKEKSAMFLLIDSIIQKYAEKKEVFDFEGGTIDNLARFFSGFGAVPVKYYHYKRNKLIWPINKLV